MAQNLVVYVTNCNLKEIFLPPNVTQIYAMNNKISTINVHPNNNLNYLDISHSNLTDIDNISTLKQSLRSLINLNIACNTNNTYVFKMN